MLQINSCDPSTVYFEEKPDEEESFPNTFACAYMCIECVYTQSTLGGTFRTYSEDFLGCHMSIQSKIHVFQPQVNNYGVHDARKLSHTYGMRYPYTVHGRP